jgi:threonine aldolase
VTLAAVELLKKTFGAQTEAHFVFNGTAANVLSLSTTVRPYHAIIASQHAHLINDECGAPERLLGAKTILVPSIDAKLTPEMIQPYLVRRGDQHASQIRAISITQPTELGTVYTLDEIKRIAEFAHKNALLLHMDGARLVNAAASLKCSLAAMTSEAGVDVLSLGGTKNGLLFGEAVVFLKPELAQDFKYQRKQAMQLPSKTRFIAAQFLEFIGTDLWLENAKHANRLATRLADGLRRSRFARVTQPTQANGCFVIFPKPMVSRLKDEAFFYVWDEHTFECRLMTSWDTTESDIDRFLEAVETLGAKLAPEGLADVEIART